MKGYPSPQIEESVYCKVTRKNYEGYIAISKCEYIIKVEMCCKAPSISVEPTEATEADVEYETNFLKKYNETFEYIDEEEFEAFFKKAQKEIVEHVYDASLK